MTPWHTQPDCRPAPSLYDPSGPVRPYRAVEVDPRGGPVIDGVVVGAVSFRRVESTEARATR